MSEAEDGAVAFPPAQGGGEQPPPDKIRIVGISSHFEARPLFHHVNGLRLRVGDRVIVDAGEGEMGFGEVAESTRVMEARYHPHPLRTVIRRAGEEDLKRLAHNERLEDEAVDVCRKKISEMKLSMKLIDVKYTYSRRKATFFFSAEGRVDFRRLVKSLAGQLSIRVEMRQVGVRDGAKIIGGCDDCGRELCCTSFMKAFDPITVRMAKDQNLSLNPSRLSGVCGRLKCCLRFEHSHYAAVKKRLPACKKKVGGCNCTATVIRQDMLKEEVTLALEGGERMTVHADDLTRLPSGQYTLKRPVEGAS
ncbi:MAG: regulatory iron-sulfur-containing complex subunit RicT [bacterium]